MIKFDLDPTVPKVVLIGICIFIEALIGGILVITNEGKMPNPIQWLTILCVATLATVLHFSTFLRGEEKKENGDKE